MNTLNHKSKVIFFGLIFTLAQHAFAGNFLEITAEIESTGECNISVSPSVLEFKQHPAPSHFLPNDAVEAIKLKLNYQCEGYETNVQPKIVVTGTPSNDAKLFLNADPKNPKGVGFMLKNGEVTNLSGFYSAGNTLSNGDNLLLPAGAKQGEVPLTVGFIRQAGNEAVTAGTAKASILLTVLMP